MKNLYKLILLPMLQCGTVLWANNLQITNVQRLDAGGARNEIEFTVSWENSWNVIGAPGNHDAAWIFVKFGGCSGGGLWSHAMLDTTAGAVGTNAANGHTLGADLVFAQDISRLDRRGLSTNGNHNTGVMIKRSTIGMGNITSQVCTLRVEANSSEGTPFDPLEEYDIKVFGIEMVYVNSGSYVLGGGFAAGAVNSYWPNGTNESTSQTISSETGTYNLRYGCCWGPRAFPAQLPKGVDGFYCKKYETSQGQYVDFLLTTRMPGPRFPTGGYNSNGVHIALTGGLFYTNYPNRAMGYVSTNDMLAYLDWACLRPMTDLEYEKACNGPGGSLGNAWGIGPIVDCNNVSYPAEGQMTCDVANANVNYNNDLITDYPGPGTRGVMECGVFAREANETRSSTGATYYGIMEMSGNVSEVCVNGYEKYNLYTGVWGDGVLSATGGFDVPDWITMTGGNNDFVAKGGHWQDAWQRLLVTDRNVIVNADDTRSWNRQMRGVR